MRKLWNVLLNALYPPHCLACASPVAQKGVLCGRCWSDAPFISRPYCARLGVPFSVGDDDIRISLRALAEPPVFESARSVARYDGIIRELTHRLKYNDQHQIVDLIAPMMVSVGAETLSLAELLIPVPLHWRRLLRRRFNQSALLVSAIAARTGAVCALDVLVRKKATAPQYGLSRVQRISNVSGAFKIRPSRKKIIEGKRIVLVDDVYTTGATLNACSKILRDSGAARIDVLTFAVVTEVLNS